MRELDFIGAVELAYDRTKDDATWLADLTAFVGPSFGPGPLDLSSLSAAERDVTCRLLDGHGNERIARDRGTAVRTVANQVASIFRKLNVSSRSELSALLYRRPSA